MKSSKAYEKESQLIEGLWEKTKERMYSLSNKEKQLGLGEKGITKYFTPNCDMSDSERVSRFMKAKNIEGYINRIIKVDGEKTTYEIRNAAVLDKEISLEEFEGCIFKVTTGDYNELLSKVNENLELAAKHASNSNEKEMLVNYVKSFADGSLDSHKDGSRFWIKNKGPIVETYIGFIETYRDPQRERSEFEAFVAMVNKVQSVKFQRLVDNAEVLLPLLPWGKGFEIDVFSRPDFTSLDVMTFTGFN